MGAGDMSHGRVPAFDDHLVHSIVILVNRRLLPSCRRNFGSDADTAACKKCAMECHGGRTTSLDFMSLDVRTRPRLSEACVLGIRLVGLTCSVAFAMLRGH